jgi:DNA-binding transcriptional LysR family regulator
MLLEFPNSGTKLFPSAFTHIGGDIMEMHQLEYVLAVAKYNNFTRAAEEIRTSQSSLSQQIGKLENELGISLFMRTTRSVQLTPAGAEFVTHAKRIMAEVAKARLCINEYVSIEKGNLTLGVIAVVGHSNIPKLIVSFQNNFPGIKMTLIEEQCEELLRMLHASKIDVAICQIATPDPNFQFYPLLNDKMVLVTNHTHALANRKSVDIKELENEKFILTPPTSGHYKDFQDACQAAGFAPKVIVSCAIVKTMLGLVREDLGVTVLSSHVVAAENDPNIRIIPITPTIPRRTVLAVRNNDDIPPTLKVFLKYTSQWINTQNTQNTAGQPKVTAMKFNSELQRLRPAL